MGRADLVLKWSSNGWTWASAGTPSDNHFCYQLTIVPNQHRGPPMATRQCACSTPWMRLAFGTLP